MSIQRKEDVGGQAVIEGVMMRSPTHIATACRLPDGRIEVQKFAFKPVVKRYRFLGLPVLRGAISFFEMLFVGMKTLQWSADLQMQFEQQRMDAEKAARAAEKGTSLLMVLTMILALGIGVGLFFFIPVLATQGLTGWASISKGSLAFNVIAGVIRIVMILLYIWGISRYKELARVFEYHGAEHKSIFAYENGEELTIENARKYTTHHPRCGTSFIIIVALLSVLLFSAIDAAFAYWVHPYATNFGGAVQRFGVHFLFLPFVAGISFEALKLSGKTRDNPLTRILIAPGLWLQRITTIEPDDAQLEVALVALKASLDS